MLLHVISIEGICRPYSTIKSVDKSDSRLITCFVRLIEIDDFMANLWKIHLAVKKEGYAHVRLPRPPLSSY